MYGSIRRDLVNGGWRNCIRISISGSAHSCSVRFCNGIHMNGISEWAQQQQRTLKAQPRRLFRRWCRPECSAHSLRCPCIRNKSQNSKRHYSNAPAIDKMILVFWFSMHRLVQTHLSTAMGCAIFVTRPFQVAAYGCTKKKPAKRQDIVVNWNLCRRCNERSRNYEL